MALTSSAATPRRPPVPDSAAEPGSIARAVAAGPRSVTVLGSTGSIGCSTVDLLERHRGAFTVEALVAGRNVDKLIAQARSLLPRIAVAADAAAYGALKDGLAGTGVAVAAGSDAVVEAAARPAQWVMAAIVGAAGLAPTLEAARRGAIVALANKECLVCAGDVMVREVRAGAATLLPVDSEHNAIFQVLDRDRMDSVEKIILTASGGPFRARSRQEMSGATPEQAVAHPNWSMGAKISIDSATMMNKGLELIEAHHLFGLPENQIDIVVHPQSIIHSLVAYRDGSVLAQLGSPDMRTPIAYTMAWPDRIETPAKRLDLAAIGSLTFEQPDAERFPALRLARAALRAGGSAPATLNAANEVAVAAFLGRRIGFLDIAGLVEEALERLPSVPISTLEDVAAADAAARRFAQERIGRA
ncbi:MAG: 1-deoxy-D-xylulose-5-phosphate reductoisomerase [Alphaproteobacteria bacterium]|nr:1-deoxy-D-xylulose-5-phosphate reductoisomerase [Alphaproteobacteria bacterium]